MSRLLCADLTKLRKSRFFWICIIGMVLWGIFMKVMGYISMISDGYEPPGLSDLLFTFALVIGILEAALTSLFIGTEYSDGTIRNKLIIGHTRTAIYLSNLIVCSLAGIAMCAAYLAGALAAGIPLCDPAPGTETLKWIAFLVLCAFLMSLAFTSLFTLISMLCQNKAVSAVTCLLAVCFFIVVSIYIAAKLEQPETIPQTIFDSSTGEITFGGEIPNPGYVRGTERQVYQFLDDFLPTGVAVSLASSSLGSPTLPCLYQGLITVAATGIGIFAFRKKDIK